MSRPEHQAPPEIFYGSTEAKKYASSTRMMRIQTEMSERALELLALEEGRKCMLLDIGCGSGISGGVLGEHGHQWVGVDISRDMLDIAVDRLDEDGDVVQLDMGQGLPFRLGMFDGAISVSAVQWLCNADSRAHNPRKRLALFFSTLYKVLRRGARVALQFYPENATQSELITSAAMRAGFTGGLVVDFPNSAKAKKYFLCLFAGPPNQAPALPPALGLGAGEAGGRMVDDGDEDRFGDEDGDGDGFGHGGSGGAHVRVDDPVRRDRRGGRDGRRKQHRPSVKSKEWIMHKKDVMRLRGRQVAHDSKFTGRKRSGKFRV